MKGTTYLLWGCMGIIVSTSHAAVILTPGFEQRLEGVEELCNPPAGWQYENYADVVEEFSSSLPDSWSIDAPYEGDFFVILSTGNVTTTEYPEDEVKNEVKDEVLDVEFSYSKIWQTVTFSAGETLSFAWFFGTYDCSPHQDYAVASLVPVNAANGLTVIELVNIDVSDVGDYGATDGWQIAEFTFDATNAGQYNLTFEVYDDPDDTYSNSYFAIDGIIPEPATVLLLAIGGLIARRRC